MTIPGVPNVQTRARITENTVNKAQSVPQIYPSQNCAGLLVTAELEQALNICKAKVERIAAECRASNRKFRDIEFDLQNDSTRCQFGLDTQSKAVGHVKRVTEIFDRPEFFKDGHSNSKDIIQGQLGDCWFLSALATMSSAPGLIEKLCVARDENVGVYGFIFFKNDHWVESIIDDQLFWSLPKYDELRKEEQLLYHEDKELYNKLARVGGKGLLYASSGTSGETWVPLIEKAYAKLHGDYESLAGGLASEAIEDLTGGVSTILRMKDILDTDRFWNDELLHANDGTRLFSASLLKLDTERSGNLMPLVKGLFAGHSYSVLRVKEYRGKRFIVLRNPWGHFEWNGPWSDGSKEWTSEWFDLLDELDHVLGDDGEFVMEYTDFLETWEIIERTIIFDSSWLMSSSWMRIPPRPPLHPWTHGDIIFHFTLTKPTKAILVLSRLDDRYFKDIEGILYHHLEFTVYKRGQRNACGETTSAAFWQKSTSCDVDLESGDYVVFPRIDRYRLKNTGYYDENVKKWNERKLSRKLAQRTEFHSIAQNYEIGARNKHLEVTLSNAIAHCLGEESQQSITLPSVSDSISAPSDSDATSKQVISGDEDEMALYLGLRVYTRGEAVVKITPILGQ